MQNKPSPTQGELELAKVILELRGGLGNQLFQYAYGKSLATRVDVKKGGIISISELESKKPRTILFKMVIDTQIRGLKYRIKELRDEVAERKKGSKILDDGK